MKKKMAYCVKCGARVADDCRFCTECGAEMPRMDGGESFQSDYTYGQTAYEQSAYEQSAYEQQSYEEPGNVPYASYFDPADVKKNKAMGVLSYLGILVLIPILAGDKQSPYVRFHSNQGLVLFITNVIVDVLDGRWIDGLNFFFNFGAAVDAVFDIVQLALFIIFILGITAACKGERKELPVIGKIRILK